MENGNACDSVLQFLNEPSFARLADDAVRDYTSWDELTERPHWPAAAPNRRGPFCPPPEDSVPMVNPSRAAASPNRYQRVPTVTRYLGTKPGTKSGALTRSHESGSSTWGQWPAKVTRAVLSCGLSDSSSAGASSR